MALTVVQHTVAAIGEKPPIDDVANNTLPKANPLRLRQLILMLMTRKRRCFGWTGVPWRRT